jgi:psp operon transcriptional activator
VVERAVYRWERDGPVDSIEIDPFKSPFRPRTMRAERLERAALLPPLPVRRARGRRRSPSTAGPISSRGCARSRSNCCQRALADHRFNQRSTAEALGLTYDQLRHALKRHELLGAGRVKASRIRLPSLPREGLGVGASRRRAHRRRWNKEKAGHRARPFLTHP